MMALVYVGLTTALLPAAEPESNVLAEWNFDEGQGNMAADAGPNSLDFELVGCEWVEGKAGTALRFDRETSYGRFQKSESRSIALSDGPFTLSVWIKLDDDVKRSELYEIFNFHCGDTGPGYRLFLYYSRICFRSGNGTKESVSQISTDKTRTTIPKGEWCMIHLVLDDANTMSVYVNGELAAEAKDFQVYPPKKPKPCATLGCFGNTRKITAMGFKGCIDEFKMRKGARSAVEVLKEAKGIEF